MSPSIEQTPHQLYREAVKDLLMSYKPSAQEDTDENFYQFLDQHYTQACTQIQTLIAGGNESSCSPRQLNQELAQDLSQSQHNVYIFAAGLFAFGRFDVSFDLINYLPPSGGIRKLALVLQALLPLPTELHPWEHPEEILSWLKAHQHQLRWDSNTGLYVNIDNDSAIQ